MSKWGVAIGGLLFFIKILEKCLINYVSKNLQYFFFFILKPVRQKTVIHSLRLNWDQDWVLWSNYFWPTFTTSSATNFLRQIGLEQMSKFINLLTRKSVRGWKSAWCQVQEDMDNVGLCIWEIEYIHKQLVFQKINN